MRIVISAPTGYNSREILLPLQRILTDDQDITEVHVITPAAPYQQQFFPTFSNKFHFHANPSDQTGHNELLSTFKPNVVITPTIGLDVDDIAILRAAKQNNIPTLTFIASWDNIFKMERLLKRGHSGASKYHGGDHEVPDYFAVWNQMNADHVRQIFPDFPADKITITGPPRFDYFAHTDRIPSKQQLHEYLGFDSSNTSAQLIHGATTELYPFAYIFKAIKAAADSGKIKDKLNLYASVHPGGNIDNHRTNEQYGAKIRYSFGRRGSSPIPTFQYLPTYEEIYMLIALFQHTDVLVNQSSTVAIESMRADVPVINIKYGQPLDWWRWYRSMVYRDFKQHYQYITEENATSLAHNPKQLIQALNQYLDNPKLKSEQRQQTIKKIITHTDGSSGQRLLDFVKQIA